MIGRSQSSRGCVRILKRMDGREGGMQGRVTRKERRQSFSFYRAFTWHMPGPGVPNDASKGPRINPSPIDLLAV